MFAALIARARRPSRRVRVVYLGLAYAGLALFTTLALAPRAPVGGIPGVDKLLHFGGFVVIAAFAALAAAKTRALWAHMFFFLIAGGAIEIAQHLLVPARTGSVLDALANGLGVAAGLLAGRALLTRD